MNDYDLSPSPSLWYLPIIAVLCLILTACDSSLPVTGLDSITTENPVAARLNGVRPLVIVSEPTYHQNREIDAMQLAVLAGTATVIPDQNGLPRFVWLVDEKGVKLEVSE